MPKTKISLAEKLKKHGAKLPKSRSKPVWGGPCSDYPNGGCTFSLLSRWLVCRERFRLLVVEGLKPADSFSHRLEYGNLWHCAEEALAANEDWEKAISKCAKDLCSRYPFQQDQIVHWMNVCKVQFPVYVDYWAKHPDVTERTPLFQEQTFNVPYRLPSGRIVRLRGKWDSVDLIGDPKRKVKDSRGFRHSEAGIYLQENKSKGDIDEQALQRQLTWDLQTMMYLIALDTKMRSEPMENKSRRPALRAENGIAITDAPIRGIRYNVIRRPLSGGKGSIRQHKPSKSNPKGESAEEFYNRLARDYIAAEPEYWFMRWKVEILPSDIERFKRECFNPILEQLCDWWGWMSICDGDPFHPTGSMGRHFRLPYGLYNPLLEGGSGETDEYLNSGSEVGLRRIDNLFPELD